MARPGLEPLSDGGVPVIFYFIVGPSRKPPGDQRPSAIIRKQTTLILRFVRVANISFSFSREKEAAPVSQEIVKPDDELFFVKGDVPSLYVGPQIVQPPQPATLPTSPQTCTRPPREKSKNNNPDHFYINQMSLQNIA